jgi:hypothetical protein
VSDVYDDTELLYVDMKVCVMLCVGGQCNYVVQDECVDDAFISHFVAPFIADKFGRDVALVLGCALLWTIFSDKAEWVPEAIRTRVQAAYNNLPTQLEAGQNPVIKNLLVIAIAANGQTIVTEAPEDGVAQGGNAGAAGIGDPQYILAVMAQNVQLLQSNAQLQQSVTGMQAIMCTCMDMEQMWQQMQQNHHAMTANIRHIAQNPVRMLAANAAAVAAGVAAPDPTQQTQHRDPIQMKHFAQHHIL